MNNRATPAATFPSWLYGIVLAMPLLVIPLATRLSVWGAHTGYGFLSDLLAGSVLLLAALRLGALGTGLLLTLWLVLQTANLELIAAVGRMPSFYDAVYLADPKFVQDSASGGGLSQPVFVALMLLSSITAVVLRASRVRIPLRPPRAAWAVPALLLVVHAVGQHRAPSEAPQWEQFNIAHKLAGEAVTQLRLIEESIANDGKPIHVDTRALTRLDMEGNRIIPNGQARNVIVIAMEGIPGAYVETNRRALGYELETHPMPRLSALAEGAMTTPDYVLHAHQTIRGLYSMLCGDMDKLDTGTPKGMELLNLNDRNQLCLPAQLAQRGFSTHFLQGAGLVFMSKDRIMPHMGFTETHGREWFKRKPNYEFAWGMDDKAFFSGALDYVKKLQGKGQPWMLTLLTVGTHQPYGAPQSYLDKYGSAKMASVAYLDDAVSDFMEKLKARGVLDDTLVIITSDESHGMDKVRLASAWGLNLVFAPEQAQLPKVKSGLYGQVDLTASILDYFGFQVPTGISGRSIFRDYDTGREMISYTNGLLRYMDGQGQLSECDFQQVCRQYKAKGRFITPHSELLRQYGGIEARKVALRAQTLDQSLTERLNTQSYQFANGERRKLVRQIKDEWSDNLVGAQYMEFAAGSRTTVHLHIKALKADRQGARLVIKLKQYDRDTDANAPVLPVLKKGEEVDLTFDIDNPVGRKAFSFHLLGEGRGEIEITRFEVSTRSPALDNAL